MRTATTRPTHHLASCTGVLLDSDGTVWDAQVAERAGCRFVGLETGGDHPKDPRSDGAVEVFADDLDLTADVVRRPRWFA